MLLEFVDYSCLCSQLNVYWLFLLTGNNFPTDVCMVSVCRKMDEFNFYSRWSGLSIIFQFYINLEHLLIGSLCFIAFKQEKKKIRNEQLRAYWFQILLNEIDFAVLYSISRRLLITVERWNWLHSHLPRLRNWAQVDCFDKKSFLLMWYDL